MNIFSQTATALYKALGITYKQASPLLQKKLRQASQVFVEEFVSEAVTRKTKEKVCRVCGNVFLCRKLNSAYCSNDCRKLRRRKQVKS